MKHNREHENLHEQMKYYARLLAGLCVKCGRNPITKFRRCMDCRIRYSKNIKLQRRFSR